MLTLLAIAPEDGWAYVRSNGRVELVRPPYTQSNCTVVDEFAVDKAVQHYRFHVADQVFSDWAQLINFLNEKVRESRNLRGQTVPDMGTGSQLLVFAPAVILSDYLERIESELFPSGDWDHAENLLHDMLNLVLVQQDHELLSRVLGLLNRAREARRAAESARQAIVEESISIPDRFPRLIRTYGTGLIEYNRRITMRKQIFTIR